MPDIERNPTLGVELEMPVADLVNGTSCAASGFFLSLLKRRVARGEAVSASLYADQTIGVEGTYAVTSLDNGFNNLESAIGIVGGPGSGESGLASLATLIHRELTDVTEVLESGGAGILNFSEHPSLAIDEKTYRRLRAPKPIYDYWRDTRGWRHEEGIDAKAQNGPTTGVTAQGAAEALNLVLLTAPALIALFANSPFESGEPTGLKENRLTIWPRMFAEPNFPGDREFHQPPLQPFASLASYLRWMFGPDRAMQAVPLPGNSYKGFGALARAVGDPSLLDFLRADRWLGRRLDTGEFIDIVTQMSHLEALQFSQFLDGRIRWHFRDEPDKADFFEAMSNDRMEDLFARHCGSLYIEGRACGATFPDAELCELSDPTIAASAAVSPSAIQKGLQVNGGAYARLSGVLAWTDLREARTAAIRDGLAGEVGDLSMWRFAEAVLNEAESGLAKSERWMLAYPRYVLESGRNGADRAIAAYERSWLDRPTRIHNLIKSRLVRSLPPLPESIAQWDQSLWCTDNAISLRA